MRRLKNITDPVIGPFLNLYGLKLTRVPASDPIPYSFWGDAEAGRKGTQMYVRDDTPLHSLLHETAHYVCMSDDQRQSGVVDAGGSALEEASCCYLQLLWSDHITGFDMLRHMQDMDKWGYSFRLGSTSRWFNEDSEDARQWLLKHEIIHADRIPTWKVRITE